MAGRHVPRNPWCPLPSCRRCHGLMERRWVADAAGCDGTALAFRVAALRSGIVLLQGLQHAAHCECPLWPELLAPVSDYLPLYPKIAAVTSLGTRRAAAGVV